MKIIGERRRSYSFDDVLARIASWPDIRGRLIKTMRKTSWLSDGSFTSRLQRDEREALERQHLNLIVTDPEYKGISPLKTIILPEHAGPVVWEVRTVTVQNVEVSILSDSKGRKVLTPARSFFTVLERHPEALFRFSGGEGFAHLPILALEPEGFSKGRLLGTVAAIKTEFKQESEVPEILCRMRKDGTYFYLKGERS